MLKASLSSLSSAADAAMEALLLEEAAEKQAADKGASSRKKQATTKKASVKLQPAPAPATSPPTLTATVRSNQPEEPTAEARAAADEGLRSAMAAGDYDTLSRSLEAHRAAASEVTLQEARAERDRLAKKRKKESQRLRKAHAGAMSALPELQALGETSDANTLRKGVEAAASHVGVLAALDEEVAAAQERLGQLAVGSASAATELEAAVRGPAVEIQLDDLKGALRSTLGTIYPPCNEPQGA